jgi:hypothetical protein
MRIEYLLLLKYYLFWLCLKTLKTITKRLALKPVDVI